MKVSKINYVPSFLPVRNRQKDTPTTENFSNVSVDNISKNVSFLGRIEPYIKDLAVGLTKEFGEKVKPSQLKPVMAKDEFSKIIPTLTKQNYVPSESNVENGIFNADLHSHTNYSDGRIFVKDMLEQAAEYGNKVKSMTGKPFIFALSDHDGIKGDIEALKIISENPKKFENIKFIPATELSFVVPCEKGSLRAERRQTDVQMPEALVFNINPFSENSKTFFNDLYMKRQKMTESMISRANELIRDGNFSLQECNNFLLKRRGTDFFIMNQHWRVLDYIYAKTGILEAAKKQMKNVKELTKEIFAEMQKINIKPYSYNILRFMMNKRWLTDVKFPEFAYSKLMEEFFPHAQGNIVRTNTEHVFEDVVNYAEKEDAHLALAHPIFTIQNAKYENIPAFLDNLKRLANGRLKYIEKYHQAYHVGENCDIKSIEEFNLYNKIFDNYDFINIGGRDNHTTDFAKFADDEINIGKPWLEP